MKNSTATATTVTAREFLHPDRGRGYVGRFAPTPSGPLHAGSLVAALASFLDARANRGRWVLRIDDLDTPRIQTGSEQLILQQLAAVGLEWDGAIERQSQQTKSYRQALEAIRGCARTFQCDCTRRQRDLTHATGNPDDDEPACLSDCRARQIDGRAALRFDLSNAAPGFVDRWQGYVSAAQRDRVIVRRDGLTAYQLAVVVDDLAIGVTDVVRGADLLASTLAQIAIYEALGEPAPRYAHVPVITEPDGGKLAKSRRSLPIGIGSDARAELVRALQLLRQPTPVDLDQVQVPEILSFAIRHWMPERFAGVQRIALTN